MNIWNVRFLNIKGTTPCDLQEIVTKTDSKVDGDSVLDETSRKRQWGRGLLQLNGSRHH